MNIGDDYNFTGINIGKGQQGKTTADGKQIPGSTLHTLNGLGASTPTTLSSENSASSTIKSSTSSTTVTINKSLCTARAETAGNKFAEKRSCSNGATPSIRLDP